MIPVDFNGFRCFQTHFDMEIHHGTLFSWKLAKTSGFSGLNIYRIHIFTCSTMEREQWAPMDFGEAFGCHSLENYMDHFSVPSTENPTNNPQKNTQEKKIPSMPKLELFHHPKTHKKWNNNGNSRPFVQPWRKRFCRDLAGGVYAFFFEAMMTKGAFATP